MSPAIKSILFGGRGTGSISGDLGLAVLRISTGVYLALAHGIDKLFQHGHFGPTAKFVDATAQLGFPMPTLFAWCCAFTEAIVALLFALGLFTRPAAALLVFNMCIAAFVALLHAPWTATSGPSKEMAMLYLIPFVTILLTGAGHFSADAMIRTAGQHT